MRFLRNNKEASKASGIPFDGLKWHCKWDIYKYKTMQDCVNNNYYDTVPIDGNLLLLSGANQIWKFVSGDSSAVPFNNLNSYIGVGDSDVEAEVSQTGLQATTNKAYKKVEEYFPAINDNKILFQATFDTDEANFAWKEFTISNGNGETAVSLNRKVKDAGVKSGDVWTVRAEISLS